MKTLDKIKQIITSNDNENAITSGKNTPTSLKTAIQQERQAQSYIKLKDLVMSKDKAKIEYCDPENKKPVFIDRGTIITAKTDDRAAIAVMLEYASEKFGGSLKLNGTDEFKKQCAEVAAEKGMNIIIHPDKYHQVMQDHKADLAASIEASNEPLHQEPRMPEQQSTQQEHDNNPLGASSSSFDELRDVPAYLRTSEDNALTINDAVKTSIHSTAKDAVEQNEKTEIYAAKDAVPVPPHELGQQLPDDKGSLNTREQLLDEYQQAHSDKGLSFERDFERGEISHLPDDAAREYLQEALQGRIERANGQEKQESEL
ncbi:MAG: LPD7 domain-containing protein [Plesiomonas shigelloides]